MLTPNSNQYVARGYSIALVSAVILSTTAIFIRYLSQTYQMPALVLALWRDVFVVLTLLPILVVLRPSLLRVKRHDLLYLLAYGFVLAVFNAFLTLSVAMNGAAVSTVLVYSSAAFTVLLGWWLLKEGLGWMKLLAVGLSLGGCLLVSGALEATTGEAISWAGILVGILSGLMYAVYSLMGRSAAQRGLNPWTTLLYIFAFAAGFLLIANGTGPLVGIRLPGSAAALIDIWWLGNSLAGWGVLFLLAAGPTLAGFGLYITSLAYLPSGTVNLIVTLETIFTALIAYFFLGESLSGMQMSGGLLILSAVVCLRAHEGKKPASVTVFESANLRQSSLIIRRD